jgi:hypothetical protein
MKHPTPSDFIVKVEESHVSVIFKPSNSKYYFGRLADPEDIARFGPLSSPNVRHGITGDPSAAVATSREDQRSPRSSRAGQHRRWGWEQC